LLIFFPFFLNREGKSEGKSQLSLFFFHLFWSKPSRPTKSSSTRRREKRDLRERGRANEESFFRV